MLSGAVVRAAAIAAALVFSLDGASAAGLSPAAAVGPAAPEAKLDGAFVGRLAVSPEQGEAGAPVTVKGSGLPANQDFDLVWHTVSGAWKVTQAEYHGREYTPVRYRIGTVHTDPAGAFEASFVVPEDFGFWHDITVQQGKKLFTQAAFHVDMTVDITPNSGPVGTPITVDVKGIGWRQLQNSWLLLYDNNYTGWMSSVSQGGSARFAIPATGGLGSHVIEVMHGDFTFPYRNMQQSPEPNRPTFALNFEITEGAPVLPPPLETQVQAEVRRLPPQGELVTEPAFARVGEPFVVRGNGFEPGKTYPLQWTTVTGNRVSGSGWEESRRVIAEASADAQGRLEYRLTTPDDLGGAHPIAIDLGDGKEKAGTFWIAPSALPVAVTKGPAGTAFTLHLKGVGWTETANIYTIVYDNSYIGYSCGFNSQGDVEIFLKATGAPGWHFVDLYPAVYKGKEGRPQNFRLPQLTYAADHPGEDLPQFRFAFEVTDARVD